MNPDLREDLENGVTAAAIAASLILLYFWILPSNPQPRALQGATSQRVTR